MDCSLPILEPIAVTVEAAAGSRGLREIAERLGETGLLHCLDDPSRAELRVRRLDARDRSAPGDPVRSLGSLQEPGWVVTGGKGKLLSRLVPEAAGDCGDRLVRITVDLARQHLLRQLVAVASDGGEIDCDLALFHWVDDRMERVEPGADRGRLIEGEEIAVEIRNGGGEETWPYLFDLGLTGRTERLHPSRGAGRPRAGQPMRVDSLQVFLPPGYPFHDPADPTAWGRGELLLLNSDQPVDLDPLFEGLGAADDRSPLGRILGAILGESALPSTCDLAAPGWAAAMTSFTIARTARKA